MFSCLSCAVTANVNERTTRGRKMGLQSQEAWQMWEQWRSYKQNVMKNIVLVSKSQGGSQKACISQIETRDYCNISNDFHVIMNS